MRSEAPAGVGADVAIIAGRCRAHRNKIPLGRFGDLKDLASDASAYMTRQCLAIVGGYLDSI